ncbi:MAG: hypothetical protein J1F02_01085 [Lachnospiraceae bacterium]|nr:hypothetical protein [Lachnospiraceae bacterium]
MPTRIPHEDISVVLQGPVNKDTMKCINSIKNILPGAQIILSTWENTCTEFLEFDEIIYCKDPGCAYWNPPKSVALNINRWIVSSREGVKRATRKYVLKMRTDLEIIHDRFLDYFNQYSERIQEYVLASHKLLIPSVYTTKFLGHNADNKKEITTPLHLSDWYVFGLKEDVWNFVDIPIIEDLEDFARYYERRPYLTQQSYSWWTGYWLRKYAPEQYIGLCFAKRLFPQWELSHFLSFDDIDLKESEKFVVSNFIILDPIEFGVVFTNEEKNSISMNISNLDVDFRYGLYSQYVYEEDYQKYCDSSFIPGKHTEDIRVAKKVPWKHRLKLTLIAILRKLSPTYNLAYRNAMRIDQLERNIVQKLMVSERELKNEITKE